MKPSLTKDSTITFISRGLVLLLAAASTVIISRVLGPSNYGSYRVILLILNVASLSVLFGLGAANVYFGARDLSQLPALAGNSFVSAFGFGLLGIVVVELATLVPALGTFLAENQVDVRWVRGLILLLPLIQLRAYLAEILRAKGDIVRYNLTVAWQMFAGFATAVVLVWLLKQGLAGALVAWSLTLVAAMLLTLWLALRAAGAAPKADWQLLRRCISFGSRLHAGNVAQFLNYRLDVFLVGFFLSPAAIGQYAAATVLAEMLWEMPHAIRTVMLYQVAASEPNAAVRMTARVSRVVVIVIGALCLLTAAISRPLVELIFGAAYLPAAAALIALMPGIWTLSVGKLLAIHLAARGRPEVGTLGAVLSLATTILLDIILIPRWGIVGAAVASSISYTLSTMIIVIAFLRDTLLRLGDVTAINRGDVVVLKELVRSMRRQVLSRLAEGRS